MMRLDGDVAFVTGGGGILGQQFCKGLIEAGAKVAIVDISPEIAEAAAEKLGENAHPFCCDVSSKSSVTACVSDVCEKFGKIDILLNNAATKTADVRDFFTPFEEYDLDVWREVMSVNIDGMFLVAQAVGKAMLSQGRGGRIVQTASIYGLVGPDSRIYEGSDYLGGPINTPAVYSASKAAVIGLTKWLATHWARENIRVNCLVPGGVGSGQNSKFADLYSSRVPINRMAKPEEMIAPMLFLVARESSYVTGQVLAADGGWTAW
jgi:NAD(P)-dependent dehydrogenase (short-subunit alcohol dehydrogenase family)